MPIKLVFQRKFGPFEGLSPVELADFSVLTGENGAGKTSLMTAINDGAIRLEDAKTGLPLSASYFDRLTARLDLNFTLAQAQELEDRVVALAKTNREAVAAAAKKGHSPRLPKSGPTLDIAEWLGKTPDTLTEQECRTFAVSAFARQEDVFGLNLAQLSMGYLRTYQRQTYANFLAQHGDSSLSHLVEPGRSVLELPPPWKLASEVLKPFGFQITGPDVSVQTSGQDLNLKLRRADGQEVPPTALSGGENTLLALALAQYTAQHGQDFVDVILLDESLATLHPSILSLALQTLRTVFVNTNNIRVLLSTHAPSAVALSGSDGLFEVRQDGDNLQIEPASTDRAIGLLTRGVPSLRVEAENCRQIFVESPHDELIYSRLYHAVSHLLEPEVALTFISAGAHGKASCDTVKELAKKFFAAGNSTVRGLVDWDGADKNNDQPGIVGLSDGERYSIENMVLDPLILVGILSLDANGRKLIQGRSIHELLALEEKELQQLVDSVLARIETSASKLGRKGARATSHKTQLDPKTTRIKYSGGVSLAIPNWALTEQGHSYADWVLHALPQLKAHLYRNGPNNEEADKLVSGIAVNHSATLRDFLPISLVETFARLQRPRTGV